MTFESSTPPSSIEGIKRLAQRIRRQSSIPHHEALNRAALAAGFENFAHARRRAVATRPGHAVSDAAQRVFITAYWHDPATAESARETLAISLQRPLDVLLSRSQFHWNRHLLTFRRKAPDHVECRAVFADQRRSRIGVCGVARVLLFVQETELHPLARQLVLPIKNWHADPLPGLDHASTWRDGATGGVVYVDEPYGEPAAARSAARSAWAARHGFELALSPWPGLYAPHAGSRLYLFGRDAGTVQRVIGQLATMEAGPEHESWHGESAPYRPTFRSPGELGSGRVLRPPRNALLARSTATTVPFALALSGQRRRPRARMTLDFHEAVAAQLRLVIGATKHRPGISSRLERVRCELDDWVQVEYDGYELEPERFSAMYYGELGAPLRREPLASELTELIRRIDDVRMRLATSYPECRPLREVLRQVDLARRSAEGWRHREHL